MILIYYFRSGSILNTPRPWCQNGRTGHIYTLFYAFRHYHMVENKTFAALSLKICATPLNCKFVINTVHISNWCALLWKINSKQLCCSSARQMSCSSVCHQLDSWSVFAYPKQRATVLVGSFLKWHARPQCLHRQLNCLRVSKTESYVSVGSVLNDSPGHNAFVKGVTLSCRWTTQMSRLRRRHCGLAHHFKTDPTKTVALCFWYAKTLFWRRRHFGLARHFKTDPTQTVALCFGYAKTLCWQADGKADEQDNRVIC
jgi:hypothetical protein